MTDIELMEELRAVIDDAYPGSREKSIVLTKIDEARLWLEELHYKLGVTDEVQPN